MSGISCKHPRSLGPPLHDDPTVALLRKAIVKKQNESDDWKDGNRNQHLQRNGRWDQSLLWLYVARLTSVQARETAILRHRFDVGRRRWLQCNDQGRTDRVSLSYLSSLFSHHFFLFVNLQIIMTRSVVHFWFLLFVSFLL